MNLKSVIIIIALSFLDICAHAQDHLISLSKKKLNGEYRNYKVVEVIDARKDKSKLGWAGKGANRKRVNFSEPFEKEIFNFLNKELNVSDPSVEIPIVVRVKKLDVYKSMGAVDIAYEPFVLADIDVDFLALRQAVHYEVLNVKYTIQSASGTKHSTIIPRLFDQCFNRLDKVNFSDEMLSKFVKIESNDFPVCFVRALKPSDLPFFTQKLKNGIYHTHMDFRENNPVLTDSFYVKSVRRTSPKWISTYNKEPYKKGTSNSMSDIWGYCFEGTVYVYFEKQYFPIEIDKLGELSFKGFRVKDFSNAINSIGFIGLAGGAIVALEEVYSAKNSVVKYLIDPLYGTLSVADTTNEENSSAGKTGQVVIYRRAKNEIEEGISVFQNSSLIGEFQPGFYKKIDFSGPFELEEFCLDKKKSTCESIMPTNNEVAYLAVTFTKKELRLSQVNTKLGQYYLREIDILQQKKDKKK